MNSNTLTHTHTETQTAHTGSDSETDIEDCAVCVTSLTQTALPAHQTTVTL